MDFIHSREYLNQGDVVVLNCDTQCNFRLIDDSNFTAFQRGGRHTYYGGFFQRFPAKLVAPSPGNWNVVVDLGGARANIRYAINVSRRS